MNMKERMLRCRTIFYRLTALFADRWPALDQFFWAFRSGVAWKPTYEEWAAERINARNLADERDEYARRLKECEEEKVKLRDALSECRIASLQKQAPGSTVQSVPRFQQHGCFRCGAAFDASGTCSRRSLGCQGTRAESDGWRQTGEEYYNKWQRAEARVQALQKTLEEVQAHTEAREAEIVHLRIRNRMLCPEHTSAHAGNVVHTLGILLTRIAEGAPEPSVRSAGKALLQSIYDCDGWSIAFGPREVLPRKGSADLSTPPFIPSAMDASWRSSAVVWHLFEVNEDNSVCGQLKMGDTKGLHELFPTNALFCLGCIHWFLERRNPGEEK